MLRRMLGFVVLFAVFTACTQHYTPKPRGYYRIEFPEKAYVNSDLDGCPFSFDFPHYGILKPSANQDAQPCWVNIEFVEFNAKLHVSYLPIKDLQTLDELIEDAHAMAYAHTVKATAIKQQRLSFPERRVFGTFYDIQGNTASSFQFYVTDSNRHYLRAALYFNEKPKVDSIQPVLDYLRADLDTLVGSISWK